MRLYIIRHADPDYDNHTITPAGHLEAQALARRLAGVGLTHIYCSPLDRAQHTMQYTADLLKIEPITEDWLRELSDWRIDAPDASFGRERIVAWDVHGEIVRACEVYPNYTTWYQRNNLDFHENFEVLIRHSDDFLKRHGYTREGGRYRRVRPNNDQIAVFCHNGLGLTWLAHLLQIPVTLFWAGFWLAPSSVTTVLFDERSVKWAVPRCLGLGDVSHLYEARLPVRPRGIIANFE
jgi:broad specificity phosphatase PhoE